MDSAAGYVGDIERIRQLLELVEKVQRDNELLRMELEKFKQLIFGSKRERYVSEQSSLQTSLFNLESAAAIADTEKKHHIEYDRKAGIKHPGRNELPAHLPVEEVIIEPEEDTSGMTLIGKEITETLEYTPASLVKKRTIRLKYAKPNGEGVVIGKLPSRPLPKSIAEASLVAYIIICKFIDHLPFFRQIQRFSRDYSWEVSDSTINEWFVAVCTLLHPLYEVLKTKVIQSSYLQVDESPIKVLDRDHEKGVHQGYQWVYYAPEKKLVYFNYRKGRGQHGPKEILSGYRGVLQADGWQVYDKFDGVPDITLLGCMAHARRKFFEAVETNKTKSQEALAMIQKIYTVDRSSKDLPLEEKKLYRDQHMRPLFNELIQWVGSELQQGVEPKSAYGKALFYVKKQWPKLIRIVDFPQVELDNNLVENKIRPLALGRKNYLFGGSHQAAERIAMMYSFFGSCKAHGINPYDWLKSTLEKITDTKLSELEKLLPGM